MSTKLFLSFAVALGLSGCLTEIEEDDPVRSPDDQEEPSDPGSDLDSELTGEPVDRAPTDDPDDTCGGEPRRKADGPCLPN